ncbi:hypothetical protein [Streptomyces sp. NPDC001404]|uniref:hypothetical protein n=1 Tax=Streptomyces sp. NPDC001404 TaxID=3364571 RepID=UPI0036B8D641
MAPKLANLVDSFGAGALNRGLWNVASAAPNVDLDASLDRAFVTCTTSYYTLGSGLWDATASTAYAKVTPVPTGNGSTQTFFEVVKDANNKATISVSGGTLAVSVTNVGTATTTTVGPYDAYNHAWWRIRETSGSFAMDTSPDAYTWTTRATIAYTWAAASVELHLTCGYYGTETAGMRAYLEHVNTTAGGLINVNWPLIEEAWAPYWNCAGGDSPLDRYVEVTPRTRGRSSIQRGRQYELDQVRAGEYQVTLANTDGALDPLNGSGPWAGRIMAYQPYRKRAQWPPTRNLLTQVVATGGDLGGYNTGALDTSGAGQDVFSSTDPSGGGQIVADATAWQGGRVLAFQVPSGSAAPAWVFGTLQTGVIPGQSYTLQVQVRNTTASTSLQVKPFFGWYTTAGGPSAPPSSYTYGTSATLSGGTTAAWTQVTVTATAPANAAAMVVGVAPAATAAATCTVQADGMQLEKGTTATTWTPPGVWYPMYGGFVERWPSRWNFHGTYGAVEPVAVDAMSLLSQVKLLDPLTEEINSHNPRFLFTLGDPQNVTSFTDSTGTYRPAPIGVSKNGPGSLTSGNQITAASSTGTYTGSTGTVVTIANPNPGTNLISAASFISLGAVGIKGPANPAGTWTRMVAFRYTGPTPSSAATIWSSFDPHAGGGSALYWQVVPSGQLQIIMTGPANTGYTFPVTSTAVTDANWHLAIISYNYSAAQAVTSLDGVNQNWASLASTAAPTGLVSDSVGGWIDPTTGNGSAWQYQGDISFVAEFPNALSGTDCTNLYTAWKSACSGESTDTRYARILRYAGYTGVSSLQSGLTTSMGAMATAGQDALSALQAVVDTENGEHYVDRVGTVTFKSRSARYNALTPLYTFGERADLGEWPYEDCQFDYDATHLSNQITVTQSSTNQAFYAQDATSIANYFPRTLTRTINSSSALECQDAAGYLLSRYKNPATRVSAIKLHPSANPAMWPMCLSLELGMRVRVMRRPPNVPADQVDVFVEQIEISMDDQGDATWTLQCSPVDLTPYGSFASWHTTLATTTAAGVTTVTVNASADTTNPLAAQLAAGQQLVLGQNSANAETVTVASVGATSPGWTSATITLTAATTKSHTAGDTVCEPLPAGTTDPTTWDPVDKFDAIAFAY